MSGAIPVPPADEAGRAELELKELVAGELDSGEDFAQLAGWEVPDMHPPAILRIRAVDFPEPVLGLRARYWVTSLDENGQLIAIGWKDGLRVVSELVDLTGRDERVAEPGVWLQDEGDWYRSLAGQQGLPRFLAGVSRTWIDVFVSYHSALPELSGGSGQAADPWLSQLLTPPARERIARTIPAREVPSLVGRRVLYIDDQGAADRDLRAISEPMLDAAGNITVTVVGEADWYLWSRHSNNKRHPSMRLVRIADLWAET